MSDILHCLLLVIELQKRKFYTLYSDETKSTYGADAIKGHQVFWPEMK